MEHTPTPTSPKGPPLKSDFAARMIPKFWEPGDTDPSYIETGLLQDKCIYCGSAVEEHRDFRFCLFIPNSELCLIPDSSFWLRHHSSIWVDPKEVQTQCLKYFAWLNCLDSEALNEYRTTAAKYGIKLETS